MNLLVTAGNTQALIDRVRCITNIFTGRTGAAIALHAHQLGHHVTLLTSHPEAIRDLLPDGTPPPTERWALWPFRTFEQLQERMADLLTSKTFDGVVHCAAVSDYLCAGVFAPAPDTSFHPESGRWESTAPAPPSLLDRQAGKVKSDEGELWIRLVRAPKLVDQIRQPWGFRGILVKFKLEVGVSDDELLVIAERSRTHSNADLLVANTLETSAFSAFIGPIQGRYEKVARRNLPARLLEVVEQVHAHRATGGSPNG